MRGLMRTTVISGGGGGGGGFSSLAKILGECSSIHSPTAILIFLHLCTPPPQEMEISSRTLIPLFMPGSVHSGPASLDDCGRMTG